jgi:raffinose/stachyose/melibiose transport system permease protein
VGQGRYGQASALAVLFTVGVAVLAVAERRLSRMLQRRVA